MHAERFGAFGGLSTGDRQRCGEQDSATMRRARFVLAVLVPLLIVASCGSDDGSTQQSAASTIATTEIPAAGAPTTEFPAAGTPTPAPTLATAPQATAAPATAAPAVVQPPQQPQLSVL